MTDTDLAQTLRVIRQHVARDPSALAASIMATCDAALAAHESRAQAASVPDRLVMVPRGPTPEMIDAAAKNRFDRLKSLRNGEREPLRGIVGSIEDDWKAMLAAAPQPLANDIPQRDKLESDHA